MTKFHVTQSVPLSLLFFQVAPQLYSRGRVDPVSEPTSLKISIQIQIPLTVNIGEMKPVYIRS
jgi:hypothetical protein